MDQTPRRTHTGFKIYVSIVLTIIALLLAGILGALVYGGSRVATEATSVRSKADDFSSKIDTLNKNLENLNSASRSFSL